MHAYGHDDATRWSYFDDAHGFAAINEKLLAGPFAAQVKTAQIVLDDVVFESPTRAALAYHVHEPNYTDLSARFGEAVLVDGAWKITRATYCGDVALAGLVCPT